MKTKRIWQALFLSALIFLLSGCGDEKLSVVYDGKKCYTFKHGTWIAEECYPTYEIAKKSGEEWLFRWNKHLQFKKKAWGEVSR